MGSLRPNDTVSRRGALRVLVADDDALTRTGVRCVVKTAQPDAIVDEVASLPQVAAVLASDEIDVVLLGSVLGGRGPADTLPLVLERAGDARVIVLGDGSDLDEVRQAFAAGADGYVPKQEALHHLVPALSDVVGGSAYLDPHVGAELAAVDAAGQDRHGLTATERHVLEFVADGLTSREISDRLQRPPRTIEGVRARAQRKLGVTSLAELIQLARRGEL